ncbi:hypothetical protein MKEN_00259100 [Mycena kentingensis (nom. inval.)]|nr:hypothetical protein MKEN_00259100 [Mycena kentingensis (nom. inval.)]
MYRTRSQPQSAPQPSRPIVVHQYTLSDALPASPDDLIRLGRLVAGHGAQWRNVAPSKVSFRPRDAFKYVQEPPRVARRRTPPAIPQWGTKLGDGELVDLTALDEFENTDLASVLAPKRTATEASLGWDDAPAFKRRKFIEGSLRDIVPMPHILPTLPASQPRKFPGTRFNKATPLAIYPHTLPLTEPSPYARRSWAIPLRGPLPWKYTTPASVLTDSTQPPQPPDPATTNEITWTEPSLLEFWKFLLQMRAKRQLGPIGLSFNVAPSTGIIDSQFGQSYMGIGQPQTQYSAPESIQTISTRVANAAIPLHTVDHIRIYHDAMNSMQLRNVLYAWAYTGQGASKVRVLKGARLPLLDERAQGIVIW